ncbi:MAG: hypothetical protein JWN40_162 [Phycisphaerales bacterium]|nr:hypothetical protein [Phycisphaerales bacterium]
MNEPIDDGRFYFRFVTLNINNQSSVQSSSDLGDPISARRMTWVGNDAASSKWLKRGDDARVVRCNDNLLYTTALTHLVNHVLDQWFSGGSGENFGWETS